MNKKHDKNIKWEQAKKSLKAWKKSSCCENCGTKINLTFHHIIPKSKGGSNDKSNLMILCRRCHNYEHSGKFNFEYPKKIDEDDLELLILLRRQGYTQEEIFDMIDLSKYGEIDLKHLI